MRKQFYIFFIILILSISICFASGPEWSLTVTDEPDSGNPYLGGHDRVSFSYQVTNQNSMCKMLCAQRIVGITSWEWADVWVEAGQTAMGGIGNILIPEANPTTLTLEVKCKEEDTTFCGGESDPKEHSTTLTNVYYDGDTDCTTGNPAYEDCTSSDCYCDSDEYCSPGHSKADNEGCVEWCGDGYCDSEDNNCPEDCNDENNCGSFGNKCSSGYECQNGQCVSLCGNGEIDTGEECDGSDMNNEKCKSLGYDYGNLICTSGCEFDTSGCERCSNECSYVNKKICVGDGFKICEEDNNGCLKWSSVKSCGLDKDCSNGNCIDITTNQNCGFIDNDCGTGFCVNKECVECRSSDDCKTKQEKESTGRYECNADKTGRYEIILKKGGECVNGVCSGSTKAKGNFESCSPMLCIDGECKKNILETNAGCTADEQCESNLCYDGICQNGVSIELGSQLSSLQVGKEMDVDLSIVNTIDDDIPVQLIMIKDSGMSVSGSEGAASGSLSQFNAFEGVMSRGQKAITLKLGALESGIKELKGKVLYTLDGKQREYSLNEDIRFYECGDGECNSNLGEKYSNCPSDCEKSSFSFFEGLWNLIKRIFGTGR